MGGHQYFSPLATQHLLALRKQNTFDLLSYLIYLHLDQKAANNKSQGLMEFDLDHQKGFFMIQFRKQIWAIHEFCNEIYHTCNLKKKKNYKLKSKAGSQQILVQYVLWSTTLHICQTFTNFHTRDNRGCQTNCIHTVSKVLYFVQKIKSKV